MVWCVWFLGVEKRHKVHYNDCTGCDDWDVLSDQQSATFHSAWFLCSAFSTVSIWWQVFAPGWDVLSHTPSAVKCVSIQLLHFLFASCINLTCQSWSQTIPTVHPTPWVILPEFRGFLSLCSSVPHMARAFSDQLLCVTILNFVLFRKLKCFKWRKTRKFRKAPAGE